MNERIAEGFRHKSILPIRPQNAFRLVLRKIPQATRPTPAPYTGHTLAIPAPFVGPQGIGEIHRRNVGGVAGLERQSEKGFEGTQKRQFLVAIEPKNGCKMNQRSRGNLLLMNQRSQRGV